MSELVGQPMLKAELVEQVMLEAGQVKLKVRQAEGF